MKMDVKKWHRLNNFFVLSPKSVECDLPKGIYRLERSDKIGLYLDPIKDEFEFPFKVYGIGTKFIDRVKKTYDNISGNLGILMTGIKGTGKTVEAKLICNKLNLPVILIAKNYKNDMINFISDLPVDCVLFFDEFEKIFENDEDEDGSGVTYDKILLSVMDGAMPNNRKHVFLLTTNKLHINDNLLNRPGRIRYVKLFKNLEIDVIMEILNDKLINKKYEKELIKFISTMEIITIDTLKSLIEEVNIHEEAPDQFKDCFNSSEIEMTYTIYEMMPRANKKKIAYESVNTVRPFPASKNNVGKPLYVDGYNIGRITEVKNESNFKIKDGENNKIRTFYVEKSVVKHNSFLKYVF